MILDMVRAGDEEGGKRNWKRWQLRMGRVGLGGARCGGGCIGLTLHLCGTLGRRKCHVLIIHINGRLPPKQGGATDVT